MEIIDALRMHDLNKGHLASSKQITSNSPVIAAVGAGGKTSLLITLARQFKRPSIVTTTTHFGEWQKSLADRHIIFSRNQAPPNLDAILDGGVSLISGEANLDSRLSGLEEQELNNLRDFARENSIPLLIEADGSRQLPLKAPAPHEPALPPWVDITLVCAGLSGLGEPITEKTIHRVERFSQITHACYGDLLKPGHVSSLLSAADGGLRNIPNHARRVAVLTQANEVTRQSQGMEIAVSIKKVYDQVILTDLTRIDATDPLDGNNKRTNVFAVHESVGAVILAAGGSERFGEMKVVQMWQGKPLIRYVAEAALLAGCDPIIVVLGREPERIIPTLEDLPIAFIHNKNWKNGQSTSIRTGLSEIKEKVGAAIFLVADQPLINPMIIRALMEKHQQTLSSIIMPVYDEKPGNPVLFDQRTFSELNNLEGDQGGRSMFRSIPPTRITWYDSPISKDIDYPQDLAAIEGFTQ